MDLGFLPTIKCSNCGNNVEISAMGDHVCAPSDNAVLSTGTTLDSKPLTVDSSHAPSYATVPPSPPPSAGLDAPDQLTVAMAGKPGRSGAPPRIDPSIASMCPPWWRNTPSKTCITHMYPRSCVSPTNCAHASKQRWIASAIPPFNSLGTAISNASARVQQPSVS